MKSGDKTWTILLVIFLIVLALGIVVNLIISFVIALCLACITSWFGSDILMSHLLGLTVAVFIFYTFVIGAIKINIKKES